MDKVLMPGRPLTAGVFALACVLMAGCGGGGGGTAGTLPDTGTTCDASYQKNWLRNYMQDAYFWAGASPNPEPAGYATVKEYFPALLFTGNASTPADRWSYISDTASYTQFFEEGKTLGYGLAVNGLEARLPLKVRYVEALSPAAAAGIARGDVILSINGVSSAQLLASGDFAALTPAKAGDTVTVQFATTDGGTKTVGVAAATYSLTPVPVSKVLTLSNGSKVGYVVLKDFITQSETPLVNAFASFRAAGASDVIVDLRYNGGGRVSTSNVLASLAAGSANSSRLFTQLVYSAKKSSLNANYYLANYGSGFSRVVILTGQRTCSASELVINGLKPYVTVVTVGGTTCGKPFGFNPVDSCGSTYSAVNFESLNAAGQGRYYNGISPTANASTNCAVEDDFSGQLGDASEKLTAAATTYLQTGACPAVTASLASRLAALPSTRSQRALESDEFRGMRGD